MRFSKKEEVSLEERLYLQKEAENDQRVQAWLKRARRIQQKLKPYDGIDKLLNDLDLGSSEPDASYSPKSDDLGEWFSGAPSWLSRS